MPNHVSSLKRARQTVTCTEINPANRSRVRTSLRSPREALAHGDGQGIAAPYFKFGDAQEQSWPSLFLNLKGPLRAARSSLNTGSNRVAVVSKPAGVDLRCLVH